MRYWVTRARRGWMPGQPHPGYEEYVDGVLTGRVSGEGLMLNLDTPVIETAVAEMIAASEPVPESDAARGQKPLTSGLKRNPNTDERLRDTITKFDQGGNLNDKELRRLLHFYGILIRFTEIPGQSYYLIHQDVLGRHQRLVAIAAERGWTQGLLSMYGVMVEGVFDKIC